MPYAAWRLAHSIGADSYEIRTVNAYPTDGYETSDISEEERRTGKLPEIKDDLPVLEEYDTIMVFSSPSAKRDEDRIVALRKTVAKAKDKMLAYDEQLVRNFIEEKYGYLNCTAHVTNDALMQSDDPAAGEPEPNR